MRNKPLFLSALIIMAVQLNNCSHDAEVVPSEDEQLYAEANTSGLYYYQQHDSVLSAAGNSPHGTFKLRFNQIAWDALGTDGRLPQGGTFPEGSLLVKEVIRNNAVKFYAVMKKAPASPNAANGWLWIEMNADGSLLHSITEKGDACLSCHSANTNRDFTNSFDLH
jgi:hypothetical protein